MAKQTKRTKKFIKNNLDRTLKVRREGNKKKAVIERSKQAKVHKFNKSATGKKQNGSKDALGSAGEGSSDDDDDDEEEELDSAAEEGGAMGVDAFLGGGFKAGMEDGSEDSQDEEEEEDDEEDSMAEIDELSADEDDSEIDEEAHAAQLKALAAKDPEFFKYLQANDEELLKFGQDSDDDDASEDDEDDSDEEDEAPKAKKDAKGKAKATDMDVDEDEGPQVVTLEMLRSWQRSLIQHHSLRAFRRLLLAFRAAAHMTDEDENGATASYVVNDGAVFNKLIITTLKYVPVVLAHHIPYKEVSGRYKLPTQSAKFTALQRPIQAYYANLHRLLRTLPDPGMLYVVLTESAKMVPWLLHNRKVAREHVKILLDLWATANDKVRIAAFLSIRKIAAAGDEVLLDLCLKGAYQSFVRSTKLTTVHTLPAINLMKNSSSELYALNLRASYQHAFGFIRQLAVHLRGALKAKTPDSLKSVLNWQFVHCLDFWALVLSATCDKERVGKDAEMQPLIYPLVQVATGVMKLNPTSRYFPMRLHVVRSLLRLIQRTGVYIPLTGPLLEIFEAPELQRKPKGSTLAPLNLDVTLRAPQAYVRTRVYADGISDEAVFLLLEFLATQARSIAFPELVVPLRTQLRRSLKSSSSAKLQAGLKAALDKVLQNSAWVEKRRADVEFAPNDRRRVENFLKGEKGEAPLEAALRLARKVRAQKRELEMGPVEE